MVYKNHNNSFFFLVSNKETWHSVTQIEYVCVNKSSEASDVTSYLINLKLASKVAFFTIVYICGYYSTLAFVYMMHENNSITWQALHISIM
jgi:hypothetical protein